MRLSSRSPSIPERRDRRCVMYFRQKFPARVFTRRGARRVNATGNAANLPRFEELDTERKARIDYEPAYRANPGLKGNVTNLNVGDDRGRLSSTPPRAVLEADRLAARRVGPRFGRRSKRRSPKPPATTIGSPTIRRPSSGSAGRPNLTRLTATANLRRSPNASVRCHRSFRLVRRRKCGTRRALLRPLL